ncbi:extracellular solute-binding protein family 1 [Kribbella flavida DSM 17836]|uniref:Extracellular solute-binding protein family 1 n=1 Tax=Kribbella flavida (strain DSM 17836 / JCM 10339 / NBRC 14399) TaxID=479435 RepID=D2Q0Y6_KRIFD|nr:ABC transporter substrate-binding protein [Kribbella flavida]ADB35687.1 extracellular solute-binding protein family 1 [Kribbella flavida DSM 17836]
MRSIRQRRTATAAALLAVLALVAAGCGSSDSGDGDSGNGQEAPGADALDQATGVTKVTFWHGMKGANGEAVDKLVKAFNAKNSGKIEVQAVYQGDYDETITKYKTSVQQGNTPSVVQIYDIGSRFMIDSKQTVPIQSFADKDGYALDSIEPNIANYYSIDGKLNSMPFNTSMPLLYINKEAFVKAGLDPAKPPADLDAIMAAAKKLTIKQGGRTTQYGFNAAIYGWFVEQLIAQSGTTYCDNENGRKDLATQVNFADEQGVKIATWYQQMVKQGLMPNTGKKTDDAQAVFKSGTSAMHLESTGSLRGYLDAAKGKFTVMTAPFPKLSAGDTGGPIIGGASLWVNGPGHSDAEKRASWEFVKFASTPEQQAAWHTGTGYFPINSKALDLPEDKAWVAQYPQFTTAITQLHNTKPSNASSGCILGVMPQARKAAEDGLEKAVLGTDPAAAMKSAADSIKPQIDQYNKTVKK